MKDRRNWNAADGSHEHDFDRHGARFGDMSGGVEPFEEDEVMRDDELENWDLDQLDLDRLVDGEVDLPELRRIVAALEERPDGWRDCALAFLEAQALRKELTSDAFQEFADDFAAAFSDPVDSKSAEDPDTIGRLPAEGRGANADAVALKSRPSSLSRRSRRAVQNRWDRFQQLPLWQRRLAVAASIAVAFVCGVAGRYWLAPDDAAHRNSTMARRPFSDGPSAGTPSPGAGTTLVGGQAEPRGHVSLAFTDQPDTQSPQNGAGDAVSPNVARPETRPDEPSSHELEPPHGGMQNPELPNPELEVPFYERTAFPAPESIVLPAEMQERLSQANVEIRSRRQLVRVKTPTGETVLLPLETVDFVPRRSRRYQ